jgi:glycerol-3-phosphate dehydrogenase
MRFDVLAIGAGIQGATVACDAARRGLSVLLVDRGDVGNGASSNSMKIAHGGLRYLQHLDFRRSLESIRERRHLLRMAPDLVQPLACRMELRGRGSLFPVAFAAGLAANELLSWHRNRAVRPDRRIPVARFPVWYDAIICDTERLLLSFIHAACQAQPDTQVLPYSEVQLVRRNGRIVAARTSALGESEVGYVIDCTGAGSTRPAMLCVNLVVDGLAATASGQAVAMQHPETKRAVFAVPWRGKTIVGTWNACYEDNPRAPLKLDRNLVGEVLAWLGPVHPELSALRHKSVRLVHAGLVPCDTPTGSTPSDRNTIVHKPDGIVMVSGVKWTTAYGLSKRAVDIVTTRLGRGVKEAAAAPLPIFATQLKNYCWGRPDLFESVVAGCGTSLGALEFAVKREWARTLADVLLRRTGLAAAGHPGRTTVEAAACFLQPIFDWTDTERRTETQAFHDDPRFAGNVPN